MGEQQEQPKDFATAPIRGVRDLPSLKNWREEDPNQDPRDVVLPLSVAAGMAWPQPSWAASVPCARLPLRSVRAWRGGAPSGKARPFAEGTRNALVSAFRAHVPHEHKFESVHHAWPLPLASSLRPTRVPFALACRA